tara:strand:+ start:1389 stop:2297 length:909 start_codon:yes stop_codon:yes gene_type:complete
MASRTGILSDAHSEKFCLEFNAAPLGYFQANYHELPPNPNLPGIKLPRYVQTVNKPSSLDVAAVNLGKLLHINNHLSSSFVLDKMAAPIKEYVPPQVNIARSIGTQSSQVGHISLASLAGTSRGGQLAAQVSGSSAGPASATSPTNGHGLGYATPSIDSVPHSNFPSDVEVDDADIMYHLEAPTAQAQERNEVAAAGSSVLFDDDELHRQSDALIAELDEGRMSSPKRKLTRAVAFARANRTPEEREAQRERRRERRMSQAAMEADQLNTANEADPRFFRDRASSSSFSPPDMFDLRGNLRP